MGRLLTGRVQAGQLPGATGIGMIWAYGILQVLGS
jgi:hypothetical protein